MTETAMELAANQTVYAALKSVASQRPESVALVFADQQITYRDLVDRIEATAAHLCAIGLERGESFAVFAQNRPEFLYGLFAAAKLGCVFVPANFNLTTGEVGYILEHSDAQFVFHDERVADMADLRLPDGMRRPISELGASVSDMRVPDAAGLASGDDLLISYTSGSTATPKAVVHDHGSQIRVAKSLAGFWGLCATDTTVVGAPFGFLLGLSTTTAVSLLTGARVVIHRRFHPGEMLVDLVKYQATIYNGVPTMFQMMLEYAEQQATSFDLSGMRAVISSGAPMPEELRRRFAQVFGKEIQNYFGMTEAYPLFGQYVPVGSDQPAGAAGRIAPGAVIRVFDPDGRECEPGGQGELCVRASATIKRYHKNPELTASSFHEGLFKTGDLGYVDGAGYVYVTGRAKDIIKCGGANVAPVEVEGVLLRHAAVLAVAVVGVPDKILGEVPAAFLVLKPGAIASASQLGEFSAGLLAKYKVPAHFVFLTELPLGKTGKVDKNKLKSDWGAGPSGVKK